MARTFNISALFTAVDKLSNPVKSMGTAVSKFATTVKTSSNQANNALATTTSKAKQMGAAFTSVQAKFHFKNTLGHLKDISSTIGGIISKTAKWGLALGALGTASTAVLFEKVLDAGSRKQLSINALAQGYMLDQKDSSPESYQKAKAAARKRDSELVDWATKSPFEVADMRQAAARLKSANIDPSQKLFEGMANVNTLNPLASVERQTEALIDLLNGETERMKEAFNMKFSKVKGKDQYEYTSPDKKQLTLKRDDLVSFVTKTITEHRLYKGASDKNADSYEVAKSNYEDAKTAALEAMSFDTGFLAAGTRVMKNLGELVKSNTSQFSAAFTRIASLIESNGPAIMNGLQVVIDGVVAFANKVITWLGELGNTGSAQSSVFKSSFDIISNTISNIISQLPSLTQSITTIAEAFRITAAAVEPLILGLRGIIRVIEEVGRQLGTLAGWATMKFFTSSNAQPNEPVQPLSKPGFVGKSIVEKPAAPTSAVNIQNAVTIEDFRKPSVVQQATTQGTSKVNIQNNTGQARRTAK
jgi:uncharacterized protein YukE